MQCPSRASSMTVPEYLLLVHCVEGRSPWVHERIHSFLTAKRSPVLVREAAGGEAKVHGTRGVESDVLQPGLEGVGPGDTRCRLVLRFSELSSAAGTAATGVMPEGLLTHLLTLSRVERLAGHRWVTTRTACRCDGASRSRLHAATPTNGKLRPTTHAT